MMMAHIPLFTKKGYVVVKYMMNSTGKIDRALPIDLFSQPILGVFTSSQLSRYSGMLSSLSTMSNNLMTTVMGEGGISSDCATSDSLRTVHPSHMGVYDPTHTSESSKIGVVNHFALGAGKQGNDIVVTLINAKNGRREKVSTVDLGSKVIAFAEAYKFGKWQTDASGKVPVILHGREQTMVTPVQVDYIMPAAAIMFSPIAGMIPFIHNNSANRVLMSGRHQEQAAPLVNRELPGVLSTVDGNVVSKLVHDASQEKSPADGNVTRVQNGKITIRGKDGGTHIVEYHERYPYNDGTWLKQTPTVKAGDKVTKGQVLTTDNFSVKGVYSPGTNLRTAYMTHHGHTFEDAMVVSESAAKKLTSEHQYTLILDKGPGVKIGRSAIAPLHLRGTADDAECRELRILASSRCSQ